MGGGGILDGVMEQAAAMDSESRCSSSATIWATASGWEMKGEPSFRILRPVGLGGELEGRLILLKVGPGVIVADGVLQLAVALLQISPDLRRISGTRDAGAVVCWVSVMVIASPFGLHDLMQALWQPDSSKRTCFPWPVV